MITANWFQAYQLYQLYQLCTYHIKPSAMNNVMYDDESNWLKRNDHYQMQRIGGRMRAVAMPHSQEMQEMQTVSTIISDIAQANHRSLEMEPTMNASQTTQNLSNLTTLGCLEYLKCCALLIL
jgi:hypothetical protein